MKASFLKPLGWSVIALAVFLAGATVWAYGTFQQSLGALPHSVAQSTAAAAEAVAALAKTTATRADIAADTVRTLTATQVVLGKVKAAAERQMSQLPHHEATIRAVAVNTSDLSKGAQKVADALNAEIPLLKVRPFEAQSQAMRPFADSLAKATVSLNDAADAIKGDAVPFAKAMIDLSVAGTALAEHTKQAAEAVKSQHLPQLANTLDQAASTLRQTSTQASTVSSLPQWMLMLGLSMATSVALIGAALLAMADAIGSLLATRESASTNVGAQ